MHVANDDDLENKNIDVDTKKKEKRNSDQWDLIYADQMPKEPTKGELNKDFGLYVERDFYIVS
jgi:hypothetical protein